MEDAEFFGLAVALGIVVLYGIRRYTEWKKEKFEKRDN